MQYSPNRIDQLAKKIWEDKDVYRVENDISKPKHYVLEMFPYPSGAGLHVGHPLGYVAGDIYARFKRMQGFNVLHPMGFDSFGLPAEQYAIETGKDPRDTTRDNIETYKKQFNKIGLSFDWSREVVTSSPEYYKWTQWLFIEMFNSIYCYENQCAYSVNLLIKHFEEHGNHNNTAFTNNTVNAFSAEEWKNYSEKEKSDILMNYRLIYTSMGEVNWCEALGTVLANDEVINGRSERGNHPVVKKKMRQWSLRMTAYADRLLQGLEEISFSNSLKDQQKNWIGKSTGALVNFKIKDLKIDVYTTRPDTIFGVTFMTLAPEHELVSQITTSDQKQAVETYIEKTAKRSERERMADVKTISGVFTGAYAEHPFTKEPIPVWIGDYVLAGYGTGAVMAVPCGDERDYAFANFFKGQKGMSEIKNIFDNVDISKEAYGSKDNVVIVNSDFLNGLNYKQATKQAIEELEKINQGRGKINYRLRDAVFSRQRYWGEPFPVYYINGLPQMIDHKYLPIALPEVEKYLPTEDGQPPLGNATIWAWDTTNNKVVDTNLIDNKTIFPLELNTMPGWAGSSWYWMRYMDAQNEKEFASKSALDYWQNVDLYIGGSEHATGHLLYSRFWNKFLKDIGFSPTEEPFKKLINQGMILGMSAFVYREEGTNTFYTKSKIKEKNTQSLHVDVSLVNTSDELDIEAFKSSRQEYKEAIFITEENGKYIVGREVEKMSKSKYNVVTPDNICEEYGADTLRLYEMFLGPLEQAKPWNTAGISGVFGFLKKMWRLYNDENNGWVVTNNKPSNESLKSLHKTIKKVNEDIENFSFNTSVSQFMICVNELTAQNCHERAILEPLAVLISPYAPHIAEELWFQLGHSESISTVDFPMVNEIYLVESSKEYPVSFNGKMRFTIELSLDLSVAEIQELIMKDERTIKQLEGRTPNKIIIVPGKVINLVG